MLSEEVLPRVPSQDITGEDIIIIRRLALGDTLLSISGGKPSTAGLRALDHRLAQLKKATGAKSTPHLMYLVFSGYHLWPIKRVRPTDRPSAKQLEAVQLIAHGHSLRQASRKLYISEASVRWRLDHARQTTRTKTLAHLVTICWSEDFII